MKCSHIISGMTWSYSRIMAYEDCPYKFYLKYIYGLKGNRQFFSDYGSFMHLIIEKYMNGELNKGDLVGYYLTNFRRYVVGTAPNRTIFTNYFNQGMDYLKNIKSISEEVLGVEKEISFTISDKNFVGYIDLVSKNGNDIYITDNKSRALKKRGTRKKPTKSDKELDEYLRQLYLYSISVQNEYGVLPKELRFNCFRINDLITEPFNVEDYESTKKWAINSIEKITEESDWNPNIDYFKCSYLCDCNIHCEYFQMFGGDSR